MSFPEIEKNRTLRVTCPSCGTQFTTLATQVVLPGYPTFRALQEGKLNLANCPSCQWNGPLPLPIILYQPEQDQISCYIPEFSRLNEQEQQSLLQALLSELEQAVGKPGLKPSSLRQVAIMEDYEDIVKQAHDALISENKPVPSGKTPFNANSAKTIPDPVLAATPANRPVPEPAVAPAKKPTAPYLLTLAISAYNESMPETGEARPATLTDEKNGKTWETIISPVPPEKISRARELLQKHRNLHKASSQLSQESVELEELGRLFYQHLLPLKFSQVLTQLWESGCPVIHLQLDLPTDFQAVPWELLADEDGFLANQPGFIISRHIKVNPRHIQPPLAEPIQLPLRLLLVVAGQPSNHAGHHLEWEHEFEILHEALEASQQAGEILPGQVDLQVEEAPSFANLEKMLAQFKPHLVFLKGYGFYKPQCATDDPRRSGIILEDEQGNRLEVPGRELGHLLAGQPMLKGVILGAGPDFLAGSPEGLLETGPQLIRAGMPGVIVWPDGLEEGADRAFTKHFLLGLLKGLTFGEALAQAREKLGTESAGLARPAAWAEPVLFTAWPQFPQFHFSGFGPAFTRPIVTGSAFGSSPAEKAFVGRRLEQRLMRKALASGDLPVVVLAGPEGSGKTRLAKLALSRQSLAFRCTRSLSGLSWPGITLAALELAGSLREAGQPELATLLSQANPPLNDYQLGEAVAGALNAGPNIFFIDDFERLLSDTASALEPNSQPPLAAFMAGLVSILKEGRLVLATSSGNFSLFESFEARICHIQLNPLNQTESLSLMSQFVNLARLSQHEKIQLIKMGLDNPQLIAWADVQRGLPGGVEQQNAAVQSGERFSQETVLKQILASLNPTTRKLLSRTAVYRKALPVAFFQAQLEQTSIEEGEVRELLEKRLLTVEIFPPSSVRFYRYPEIVRRLGLSALEKDEAGEGVRQAHRRAARAYADLASRNDNSWLELLEAREHYLAAGELSEAARVSQLIKFRALERAPIPGAASQTPATPPATKSQVQPEGLDKLIELEQQADKLLQEGEARTAAELYEQGITLARQNHNIEAEGLFLVRLASAYLMQENLTGTVDACLVASVILMQIEHPGLQAALRILSLVKSQLGQARFETLLRTCCQKEGVDYQRYHAALAQLGFFNSEVSAAAPASPKLYQPETTAPFQRPARTGEQTLEKFLGLSEPEQQKWLARENPGFASLPLAQQKALLKEVKNRLSPNPGGQGPFQTPKPGERGI